ncbi:AraC family transcriptional regulator [Alteriqipengyuania flavescens]|uniref:helix-turn-helix domain-containing protein n=1 Tax=Alteriqipengyuania flavescens TaxID=3053610 RepID=UPI0025B50EE9|nr:AraC family transcriptional regulator [Alteriqipengyuania flavescens]WJY19631.1 AraC family transcriptional regulator [Alteriqipengyuania flavescens]WJY25571.1 AraC family transcriptional regulator [Alteriqipengyuania flavescens]
MVDSDKFRFRFLPAPEGLSPFIDSLYTFETDVSEIDDILPAYSAQLIVYARGQATMEMPGGGTGRSSEAYFLTPLLEAAPFHLSGPVRAAGVSLTARGWAALSGMPVDEYGNRTMDAAEVLEGDLADRLTAIAPALRDGEIDAEGAAGLMAEVVRDGLKPLRPQHVQMIERTFAWLNSDLNPEIADLEKELGLSARQLQRLCRRFFGRPTKGVVTRFRAIRSATILADPNLTAELRSKVTDAYYDQAHMIHEIQRYTGRTPKRLSPDEPHLGVETLGTGGYGNIDLHAVEQGGKRPIN